MEITIQQAVKAHQEGRLEEAQQLYQSILENQPTNLDANNNLGVILYNLGRLDEAETSYKKAIELKPDYAEAHFNLGNTLKALGRLEEAETSYRKVIELKPDYAKAPFNLGNTLQALGRLDEAETSYRKVIELKPDYAEAHFNLGSILQGKAIKLEADHIDAYAKLSFTQKDLNRFDEAEASYRKATELKPDYADAYNNLGATLLKLGRFDEAEKSYRKAISLRPDYADAVAYNNLGIILQNLNRFDEAETNYRKAIELEPDYAVAYNNLGATLQQLGRLDEAMNNITKANELNPSLAVSGSNLAGLLTIYAFQEEVSHPIVKVNQKIKENYLKERSSGFISDDKIIKLFYKSSSIIKKYNLKLKTNSVQVYRSNSINLNCKRHKKIFNKFNIIPKFCFGCYKVQVKPKSIIELIKLLLVFDQIKFDKNNTRKCTIETRPEISGFYKGLIYCSSLEEAYQIANQLKVILEKNIRSKLHVIVKRGCSEYPISFPDYKVINKFGPQLMNYNKDWESIEEGYDSLSKITSSEIITPNLSGLNLNDFLIIKNWIDYAKGIGDQSVYLLNQDKTFSSKIYKEAKTRIEKYPWISNPS